MNKDLKARVEQEAERYVSNVKPIQKAPISDDQKAAFLAGAEYYASLDGWIKVETPLDIEDGEYIVYFKNEKGWHVTGALFNKRWGFYGEYSGSVEPFPFGSVTHYKPLPSPPSK